MPFLNGIATTYAVSPPVGSGELATYAEHRLFIWGTGGNLLEPVVPTAGGYVDGVTMKDFTEVGESQRPMCAYVSCPGVPVQVEAGGSFAVNALLETMADGRVKVQASGRAVMRALQAGAAGVVVWAVFL